MKHSRIVANLVLPGILALLFPGPIGAQATLAQEAAPDITDTTESMDTVETSGPGPDEFPWSETSPAFTRIQLTPEGVIGLDTTGMEWRYDFSDATFVPLDIDEEDPDGIREQGYEGLDASAPIEERAIDERTVRPFERWVVVGYDEYVDGDIVAYGRVTVKGWVQGDVQSLTSRVLITETGVVEGNVQAPRVLVKDGGVVEGEVSEGTQIDVRDLTAGFSPDGLIVAVSLTVGFLFFAFLVASLAPGPLSRVEECMLRYPGRSFLVGFAFHLFVPLVLVVVAITIVGLIALPLVPLAYIVGDLMGLSAMGNRIGAVLCRRFLGGEKGPIVQATLGTLAYMLPWILTALFLGSSSQAWEIPGTILLVLNILLAVYVGSWGLGAAVLTRFGYRPYVSFRDRQTGEGGDESTPTPAPPPIPESPPVTPPPKPPGPPPRPGTPNT